MGGTSATALAEAGVVITAVDQFSQTTQTYIQQCSSVRAAETQTARASQQAAAAAEESGNAHSISAMKMSKFTMAAFMLSGSLGDVGIKSKVAKTALMLFFTAMMMGFTALTGGLVLLGAFAVGIIQVATYSRKMKEEFEGSAEALLGLTEKTGAQNDAQRKLLGSYLALKIVEEEQTAKEIEDLEKKGAKIRWYENLIVGAKQEWAWLTRGDVNKAGVDMLADSTNRYNKELTDLQVKALTTQNTVDRLTTALNGGTEAQTKATDSAKKHADALEQLEKRIAQMAITLDQGAASNLQKMAALKMQGVEGYEATAAAAESAGDLYRDAAEKQVAAALAKNAQEKASIDASVANTREAAQLKKQLDQELAQRRLEIELELTGQLGDLGRQVTEAKRKEAEDQAKILDGMMTKFEQYVKRANDAYKKEQDDLKKSQQQRADLINHYATGIGQAVGKSAAGQANAWKELAAQEIQIMAMKISAILAMDAAKNMILNPLRALADVAGIVAINAIASAEIAKLQGGGGGGGGSSAAETQTRNAKIDTGSGYSGTSMGGSSYSEGAFAPTLIIHMDGATGSDALNATLQRGQDFLDRELPSWFSRQRQLGGRYN